MRFQLFSLQTQSSWFQQCWSPNYKNLRFETKLKIIWSLERLKWFRPLDLFAVATDTLELRARRFLLAPSNLTHTCKRVPVFWHGPRRVARPAPFWWGGGGSVCRVERVARLKCSPQVHRRMSRQHRRRGIERGIGTLLRVFYRGFYKRKDSILCNFWQNCHFYTIKFGTTKNEKNDSNFPYLTVIIKIWSLVLNFKQKNKTARKLEKKLWGKKSTEKWNLAIKQKLRFIIQWARKFL